ncbi:MAG: diguanylate cyclase [Rhodoferax sp.]|nr:MAG: diguanylate cyclase [Rhodoferax sp.]
MSRWAHMVHGLRRLVCAVALGLCIGPVLAHAASPLKVQELGPDTPAFTVTEGVESLAETGPGAGVIPVIKGARGAFSAHDLNQRLALGRDRAVWLHLRVQRSAETSPDWVLNVPIPYIDAVDFYAVDSHGNVSAQKAGDTVALSRWSLPSVYPDFRFVLRDTRPVDIYLKIGNYRGIEVPLRLATVTEREQQRTLELVFCGTLLGSLVMLLLWCALRYWESHDAAQGWYMVYTLLMMLVSAQAMGLANLWFWPYTPGWADYASVVLPLLGVGTSTLFLRHISATEVRYPLLDRVLLWFGIGCGALVMMEWVVSREVAATLHGIYFLAGPLLALFTTVHLWREGGPLGAWLFAAYAPQGLAVLFMAGQMLQLFPVAWQSRYYMIFAVTLSIPLLLHALTLRSQQRLSVSGRARASDTQDALTGLLVRDRFLAHLHHAIARAAHERSPSAVAIIEVANYQHIQQQLGLTVAEQCLLRAVVKLHRVLRDVDPAGRLDIARFGVVLDGVASREAFNERMVGLIASGLIPLPGLHPEITLHFHIAAVVLDEVHPNPDTVLDELGELLEGIAPRSRRPIRFMEPTHTMPAPLEPDSGFSSEPEAAEETPPAQPSHVPSQRIPQPMPMTARQTGAPLTQFQDTVPGALGPGQ